MLIRSGLFWLASAAASLAGGAAVPIIVPASGGAVERLFAQDLAASLKRLYPSQGFYVEQRPIEAPRSILIGSADSDDRIGRLAGSRLGGPESFAVFTTKIGGRDCAVMAGADARGVGYAVYALLRKLGCGFYLSGDTWPSPRAEAFSFAGWQCADRPLVHDRIVFAWHNFLSSCSTWNEDDWTRWTEQADKMGYNAVMVHAYGNNPMVEFEFDGQAKPVGFLSTTARGRDWSTMHVNDVRRLAGGEVFAQRVFGAAAALGPDERRTEAERSLMRAVFAGARHRGMGVYFANDFDTVAANPQPLILTLPEADRFRVFPPEGGWPQQAASDGKFWLANPDTAGGYRYYKAQVAALLSSYPQITCLVPWFRPHGTPWMAIKVADMPPAWQREYAAALGRSPEVASMPLAPQIFALGKAMRAFRRALDELAAGRVRMAAGMWGFSSIRLCDRFFPPGLALIGLSGVRDGELDLWDGEPAAAVREVAGHRPVIPVIPAQDDDGSYLGRPFTPIPDFQSHLAEAGADGFGILHWTTRPLDLLFTSQNAQVWQGTRNETLRETCRETGRRWFGEEATGRLDGYLEQWMTGAPMFGRETTDWFMDHPLNGAARTIAGCESRLRLLRSMEASAPASDQRRRIAYFEGLEEFIRAFYRAQSLFQDADTMLGKGDEASARKILIDCRPRRVIDQFAKFAAIGGITRGDLGLVVSLNTRWLPHILALRQALGLEPVRVNFGPTRQEELAQEPGKFTFHFDRNGAVWETQGTAETGAGEYVLETARGRGPAKSGREAAGAGPPDPEEEICRAGVESDRPLTFTLAPLMAASQNKGMQALVPKLLGAGEYRLHLLMLDAASTAAGQRLFDVILSGHPAGRVDVYQRAGGPRRVVEISYPVRLAAPGTVAVTLLPVRGRAIISGAILEPAASPGPLP